MRLGVVRGHVVLSLAVPSLRGMRLVILEPVLAENLAEPTSAKSGQMRGTGNGKGGGKALVAVDKLGAAVGQMVAFTEGPESANPFWPEKVPIDASCALIVQSINYHPNTGFEGSK